MCLGVMGQCWSKPRSILNNQMTDCNLKDLYASLGYLDDFINGKRREGIFFFLAFLQLQNLEPIS